jgi:hypothetical protein
MMVCCENVCNKCKGICLLIIGLVFVINTWMGLNWWLVIGLLIAIKGLIMVIKPTGCGCCTVKAPVKQTKKKK